MADLNFSDLNKTYESFQDPKVMILCSDKDVTEKGLLITRTEVELSNGFEAGIASFVLAGAYDSDTKSFDFSNAKAYVMLGTPVTILLGYATSVREVFRGFIARVHFILPSADDDDIPSIEVTAMDAKGLMMANRRSRRLKANCYSDAVKEVLSFNAFLSKKDSMGKDTTTLNISNTPDKENSGGQEVDKRVEMVEESDYEFIVKAAKKFNFEFFIVADMLYFIEAKKNKTPLIVLTPFTGLIRLDVGYDISGLVRSVEVRNIDMEQGKYVGDKKKTATKISMGNMAKQLIEKQSLVYLDPTAQSKAEAGYRASYLMDSIDYRFGSISAVFYGMPELIPGRFITLDKFGVPVNNNFYLTRVRHVVEDGIYRTEIEGCANSIEK